MRVPFIVWLLVVRLTTACDSRSVDPSASQSAPSAQASASARLAAPGSASAAAPDAFSSLLQLSDAEVVVSSMRDQWSLPGFLVDEREDTRFRHNPPDPKPFIDFTLPVEVEVHRVQLRWGDGGGSSKRPRVELWRGEKSLGRFVEQRDRVSTLDLASPASGGAFRIRLSKPAADGITELDVLGRLPPTSELDRAQPRASVQGAEARAPAPLAAWWKRAPFSSLKALCLAFHQHRLQHDGPTYGTGQPIAKPPCVVARTLHPEGEKPASVRNVHLVEVEWGAGDDIGYGVESVQVLAVERDDGWFPGDRFAKRDDGAGDTRATVAYFDEVTRPRWLGEVLLFERIERVVIGGGYAPDGPRDDAQLSLVACTVKPQVSCHQAIIKRGTGANDELLATLHEQRRTLRAEPKSWVWERTPYVLPNGRIRLGPCRGGEPGTTAQEMPCGVPSGRPRN